MFVHIYKCFCHDLIFLFCFSQVIEGNKNAYTSIINDLHPPVITRYVRLIPLITQSTTICMRVELYGCPWEGRGAACSSPSSLKVNFSFFFSFFFFGTLTQPEEFRRLLQKKKTKKTSRVSRCQQVVFRGMSEMYPTIK